MTATEQARAGMSECGRVHGPNWAKWLGHLAGKPNVLGIEIGTFRGDSAEWMLQNIFTHATATYVCVDPFMPEGSVDLQDGGVDCTDNEKAARERLAPYGPRCVILKQTSAEALREWVRYKPATADAIYVDGDHRSRGVLQDAVFGFEVLKVGGVMVFDDYGWTVMPDHRDQPKTAINAFIQCYSRQIELLQPVGWQVALRKIAP
jgi:predicted O-methyltransferase YrrM